MICVLRVVFVGRPTRKEIGKGIRKLLKMKRCCRPTQKKGVCSIEKRGARSVIREGEQPGGSMLPRRGCQSRKRTMTRPLNKRSRQNASRLLPHRFWHLCLICRKMSVIRAQPSASSAVVSVARVAKTRSITSGSTPVLFEEVCA